MSARWPWLLVACCLLALAGCQSAAPRSGAPGSAPAVAPATPLDVGIGIFGDGVVDLDPDQRVTTPGVRRAEAHYMPVVLAGTLERRGAFRTVKVIPDRQSVMDLWIDGTILGSDGVDLALEVAVSDSTGAIWYTRRYEHEVNRYVYDPDPTLERRDPFQPLYEEIEDDLLEALARRPPGELARLRTVSELTFAERFAPDRFGGYLARDGHGRLEVLRLPAEGDPALVRLAALRERDRLFVDQVGAYYRDYAGRMAPSYDNWRRASHDELEAMRKLKGQEVARKVGGALAVLGGILAQAAGDPAIGTAGIIGIAGGAYLFKSGMDKGAQAKIHGEALSEMAESLGGDMRMHHITLREQTITLSGTVGEQYAQWRALLREMYRTETAPGPAPIITADETTAPAADAPAPAASP